MLESISREGSFFGRKLPSFFFTKNPVYKYMKINNLLILVLLSSCATSEKPMVKIQHYDKYTNLMTSVNCSKMTSHEILIWSRSKSMSCQKNTLYIACDYPQCRNEIVPCLSGDNYLNLCNAYSHNFPTINFASE